ncbi:MAG: glycosyltransferase [Symploca sp. SIO2D2]|nr:glycosyltransferase [Symploca sp. SIO2D2]
MKLAIINNHYQLGGAETVARQVHEGMRARGHLSDFLVADGKNYPRGKGVKPFYPRLLSRISQSRFKYRIPKRYRRYAWTDRELARLAASDYDVLHFHSFHGIYGSLQTFSNLSYQKPLVWTFHRFWGVTGGCDHPGSCRRYLEECGRCPRVDEWPLNGKDDTRLQLQRKVDLLGTAPVTVISPSRHLAELVSGSRVGRNWRVEVIPNGIDTEQFRFERKTDAGFRAELGLSGTKPVALVVNRDFKDGVKGFDIIASGLEGGSGDLNVQLAFAGGNSDFAAGFAVERGWDAVSLGYVSDRARMRDLYEASDVFLYASPGENFPCAILEAMSSACCIVSTPTDGVLEQVEEGVSGLLSKDFTGESLFRVLGESLERRDMLRDIGIRARDRASAEFSEGVMVERHEKLFSEILSQRSD